MPSIFWMLVIVVAALCLAIANMYYPIAKQAEEKRSMAITIEQTLKSELELNLETAKRIKANFLRNFERLNTGAWLVISNGNLLLGLDSKKRGDLINAYALINKANDYHDRLLEMKIDPIVGNNDIIKFQGLNTVLIHTLDKLIPLLISLTENKQVGQANK